MFLCKGGNLLFTQAQTQTHAVPFRFNQSLGTRVSEFAVQALYAVLA